MLRFIKENWFKLLVLFCLVIITQKTIATARDSRITREKMESINFNIGLGNMPGNIESAMSFAEKAAESCADIDTGSMADAADYATEAAKYAKEASQYAQKAAKNSSDAIDRCATPTDLLIYCRK